MRVNGHVGMCAVMLAIFGAMLFMAADYSPEARFLPLVIGIPALALTALQLAVELRRAARGGAAAAPVPGRLRREAVLFLYLAGLLAGLLLFGFLVGAPVFVGVFLARREKEPWPVVIGASAATLTVLYVMFELFLELSLYEGFIFGLLAA
jgi:hypothetical protein